MREPNLLLANTYKYIPIGMYLSKYYFLPVGDHREEELCIHR